jgi:hypothetical protein
MSLGILNCRVQMGVFSISTVLYGGRTVSVRRLHCGRVKFEFLNEYEYLFSGMSVDSELVWLQPV